MASRDYLTCWRRYLPLHRTQHGARFMKEESSMSTESMRVGYVLGRYPRYSETFIVNEILAHEAAGLGIEIFSLQFSVDGHFQDAIARVRAPVNYMSAGSLKADNFWEVLTKAIEVLPGLWTTLGKVRDTEAKNVYQAVLLAREVRQKDIRHLHAHFAASATTVVWLAARLAGVPYTFTAHAREIFLEN